MIPQENFGAGNGIRTRDPNLGKVVLYQLSYSRSANVFKQTAGGVSRAERRWVMPPTCSRGALELHKEGVPSILLFFRGLRDNRPAGCEEGPCGRSLTPAAHSR
jgi:hypothetical protein